MRRIRTSLIACAVLATACSGMPIAPSAPATSVGGPPAPSSGPPVASLAVDAFTVIGSRTEDWFEFQPALRLTETSGKSGAWVTSMNFHLDDIGPAGSVPAWPVHKRVNAGATRDMIDPDVYGDYELLISGHTDAQHVSVVISFADDEGRAGSVTAVAAVSH